MPSLHVSVDWTSHEPPPPAAPDVPSEHLTLVAIEPVPGEVTVASDDDASVDDALPSLPSPPLNGGPSSPAISSKGIPVRAPHPTTAVTARQKGRVCR